MTYYQKRLVGYLSRRYRAFPALSDSMYRVVREFCEFALVLPQVRDMRKPTYILLDFGLLRIRVRFMNYLYKEFKEFEMTDWLFTENQLEFWKDYIEVVL